jgi:hypothetical protein
MEKKEFEEKFKKLSHNGKRSVCLKLKDGSELFVSFYLYTDAPSRYDRIDIMLREGNRFNLSGIVPLSAIKEILDT